MRLPYGTPVQNVFIAGKRNKLDLSNNTLPAQDNYAYTLLGCYAGISGEALDTSKVRFAFGTYDQWVENGSVTLMDTVMYLLLIVLVIHIFMVI